MEKNCNVHHLFWQKSEWQKHGYTNNLRNNQLTHFYLPIDYHNEIHHEVPKLEPPTIQISRLALDRLIKCPDKYSGLDAVDDLANYIYEQDGGEQMAEHIMNQIPLIKLGQRALKHMTKY